jgi:catechol 2,3-dioxygenase-like lactoylglutathione lyase family enzyme
MNGQLRIMTEVQLAENYRLDHVGLAARDFEAAEGTFQRLGFTLTQRSRHSASLSSGAPREPLGSSNCCAMLAEGYFEVAGVTAPDRPTWIYDLLARYEGLHVVAIGVDDIDRCYEDLRSREVDVPPPGSLFREVEIDGKAHVAEFKHVRTDFDQYPEARFVFVEHATPHLLWRPNLLRHRNGARALRQIYIGADNFSETANRFARLFGAAPKLDGDSVATFGLGRGTIKVFSSAGLRRAFGAAEHPRLPSVVGCQIEVEALAKVRSILVDAGVAVGTEKQTVLVPPQAAHGALLSFVETAEA